MPTAGVDPGQGPPSAERERLTPQAVVRRLGQLEARAAQTSDETLTSAVATGRRALAEWQDLAERRRELEDEYERLAESESRAKARLRDVLDLLDKFTSGGPAGQAPPHRDMPGVLVVRMLGPFEVTIDGRRIAHWQGQRAQALMQFLTACRRRRVPRDELIGALWPDADEDSGRHRLHQAAYELRGTLRAVDPDRKPIVCAGGGYGLDPAVSLWVDVEESDALAEKASRCLAARQADEAIELGRKALALYRGDFLCQVTDADWATTERNRLRARGPDRPRVRRGPGRRAVREPPGAHRRQGPNSTPTTFAPSARCSSASPVTRSCNSTLTLSSPGRGAGFPVSRTSMISIVTTDATGAAAPAVDWAGPRRSSIHPT
jgi:DNA-binding winged helix-turn-helix (wHTH) protein